MLVKFVYAEGVDLVTAVAVRTSIAVPFLWAFAAWRLGAVAIVRANPRVALAAAGAGVITYYLGALADFGSLSLIDAGLQRILVFSYPAMVVRLDAAQRRALPPPRQWVVLGLVNLGIFLVIGGFDVSLLLANMAGTTLALLSALSFAIYMLVTQNFVALIGSVRFTVYAHSAAGAALLAHFFAGWEPGTLELTSRAWGMLLFMGTFSAAIPYFMFAEGIRRIGAPRAALISAVGPAATVVLAHVFLGEVMALTQIAGAAMIVGAVLALEGRLTKRAVARPDAA